LLLNAASAAQKIPGFFGTKLLQKATDQADQPWNCALSRLPQKRFQFAEGHFNWVQVGE
jgi:hypothetical protein